MTRNSDDPKAEALSRHRAGDHAEAAVLYSRALALAPGDPDLLTNFGALLRATERFEDAVDVHFRAYALQPRSLVVQSNLANVLDDVGRHSEAAVLRARLAEDLPEQPNQRALWARSLRNAGQLDEATALLEREMARPDPPPDIRLEYGFHQLIQGNYAEGFLHYLARREAKLTELPKTDLPRWTGQSLEGKKILVLPEQGFGDTVNFARFVPFLKERGATVHFLSPTSLHRLLQNIDGADAVVLEQVRGVAYDFWTSVLDIPVDYFHFRDKVPSPARLHIPDDARARAVERCRPFEGVLRVGVVWTGAQGYDRNAMRSVPHALMRKLADIPGVQLFSLYKGPMLAEYYADGTAAFILDAASDDADLADCAATIEAMDLVISVCTGVSHIAGSMGKEVWTLLHWEPFWLYGRSGDRTLWYPKMRLFRQAVPWDWTPVMARVRAELEERAEGRQCG